MPNQKLKYLGYDIVFQEIPDEVTLAINISGCMHRCEGCHSQYLWNYDGAYISDDIDVLFDKYGKYISCVCFMGGDQNQSELLYLLCLAKNRGLKVALYSGEDSINNLKSTLVSKLDYLKIGRYIESQGGLSNKDTNQILYKMDQSGLTDITYKMRPR